MELESNPLLERSALQRFLSVLMMSAIVLACLAGINWFIHAFELPPTITIPTPPSSPAPSAEPSPSSAPPQTSPAFTKAAVPEGLSSGPMTTTNATANPATPASTASVPNTTITKMEVLDVRSIPLPRPRRQVTDATAGTASLPRPRPVETRPLEVRRPMEETRPVEEAASPPTIQPPESRHRAE